MKRTVRTALTGIGLSAALVAGVACVPPPAPTAENWQFRSTRVTVNESQDEVRVLGVCVSFTGCRDEPKTVNIGFRVKVGVPGSAQAWVANGSAYNDLGDGQSANLSGGQANPVTFSAVTPLDVIDVVSGGNAIEVVGVYAWAVEEDQIGLGAAADTVAGVFEDALNQTVAAGNIPSDLSFLLDSIFDDIGGALLTLLLNIGDIDFGLGDLNDDALGGGLYIGLGVKGDLANIVNAAVPTLDFNFNIPIATVPPNIQRGGIFTTSTSKSFTGQTFSGQDGTHTYDFAVSKV